MEDNVEYFTKLINENQDAIQDAVMNRTNARCSSCMYARKQNGEVQLGNETIKIQGYCVDENGEKMQPILLLKDTYCLRYKKNKAQ